MTPASAFQQSLSDMKSSTIFRRSSSTHHGPRSSFGDRSRSFTTLEPLSKPAVAHHGGDPVFQESAAASQRRSSREDLSPHLCMTSALALSSDPGRHAQGSRRRDHLSAIRIVPPRHHCKRPSPFGRCLSRHAAQRSRSCTSFDAHDPRSLRSHTHSPESESGERCLRSSARSDADFRSQPKATRIFRCARQLPASIFRQRVPLPPAFAAASAPASALAFRPGLPPALMSFDLRFRLSTVARSEDLGARTASHLSTLTIHRHFRAHARARFHVYLPIEPHLSGPSCDLS